MASRLFISLVLVYVAITPSAAAQAPSLPLLETKQEIVAYIKQTALEAKISPTRVINTLSCESQDFTITGQSLIPHAGGPNGREDSWGIAQIHLPDHPDVSKQDAEDVRFAIDWTVAQFAMGNAREWTCYRNLYGGRN